MNAGKRKINPGNSTEVATLAGGCFWCLEAVFNELQGIRQVIPGYSGGTLINPSYRDVCTGTTRHAEAVQITFDPKEISYKEILEVFFDTHDPTTLNSQGADVGTQYRSAIFYHNEERMAVAKKVIEELNGAGIWGAPIVTEVTPFTSFYPAEDYHRDYFRRNSEQPYCQVVIAPKMSKLHKLHFNKLKKDRARY